MSNKVRLGLIGVGKWGRNYIKTIEKTKGVILEKIACRTLENKTDLCKSFELTNNWRDISKSSQIDGVIIATDPMHHIEIAKECIENGKPLIIEKPITLNYNDAKYLLNLSLNKKVMVKVNHIYLYHPLFRSLKNQFLKNENINSIYTIGGDYGPFRKNISSLWDWGPHDLAMCLDIIKDFPLKIEARYLNNFSKKDINKGNIKIDLFFKNNINAEINIGNMMENKKRLFKLKYEKFSYIFDPINFEYIQKINNNDSEIIEILQKKETLDKDISPLELIVKEFVEDIDCSNFNLYDLKLAKNVVSILEQTEKKLKN